MSKVNNTDNSNSSLVNVQCSTKFNKVNQTLDYLILTKDGQQFAKMDNYSQVTWTKQPGTELGQNVTSKAKIPILSFIMDTNRESKGKYQCLINFRINYRFLSINKTITSNEVQWNSADTHFLSHQFLYLALLILNFIIN